MDRLHPCKSPYRLISKSEISNLKKRERPKSCVAGSIDHCWVAALRSFELPDCSDPIDCCMPCEIIPDTKAHEKSGERLRQLAGSSVVSKAHAQASTRHSLRLLILCVRSTTTRLDWQQRSNYTFRPRRRSPMQMQMRGCLRHQMRTTRQPRSGW